MKIISFGSLNLDHVYRLPHIAAAQETLLSGALNTFCGGKGLNQSVAAMVGAGSIPAALRASGHEGEIAVLHAGCIGRDGGALVTLLQTQGVDTHLVHTIDAPTGHAIIQVADSGQNAIIIYGGANRAISDAHIAAVMGVCAPGDFLILQNEINAISQIIEAAARRGVRVFFNAAPCDEAVRGYPLHLVDTLCVNEIEGRVLAAEEREGGGAPPAAAARTVNGGATTSGANGNGGAPSGGDDSTEGATTTDSDLARILDALTVRYPNSAVIMTIGERGALYGRGARGTSGAVRDHAAAHRFTAVDTTAAGDTFFGYYVALIAHGNSPAEAMRIACCAASLSITREGAAPSIPRYAELEQYL